MSLFKKIFCKKSWKSKLCKGLQQPVDKVAGDSDGGSASGLQRTQVALPTAAPAAADTPTPSALAPTGQVGSEDKHESKESAKPVSPRCNFRSSAPRLKEFEAVQANDCCTANYGKGHVGSNPPDTDAKRSLREVELVPEDELLKDLYSLQTIDTGGFGVVWKGGCWIAAFRIFRCRFCIDLCRYQLR